MLRRFTLACALGAVVVAPSCGGGFHRNPRRPVVREDPDRQPFSPRPPGAVVVAPSRGGGLHRDPRRPVVREDPDRQLRVAPGAMAERLDREGRR